MTRGLPDSLAQVNMVTAEQVFKVSLAITLDGNVSFQVFDGIVGVIPLTISLHDERTLDNSSKASQPSSSDRPF